MSIEAPNNQKKPKDLSKPKLYNRRWLFGNAVAIVAGGVVGYLGGNPSRNRHGTRKPAGSNIEAKPTVPSDFETTYREVQKAHEDIARIPTIKQAKDAREIVNKIPTSPDKLAIVFSFTNEKGEKDILHYPNIRDIKNYISMQKKPFLIRKGGKKVDDHMEGGDIFSLDFSDTTVDIGVSNRFVLRQQYGDGHFSKPLTIFGVKRARYSKTEKEFDEYISYTPVDEHLRTKEIVEAGKMFVAVNIDKAKELLQKRCEAKRKGSAPKNLDMIAEVCKRLAVIEHVDPFVFHEKAKGKSVEEVNNLFRTVYAEYALNGANSFGHLLNSQGAGGMMQIITKTYRDVRNLLIEDGLFTEKEIPEDSFAGRKDPFVSALISLYLCHHNLKIKHQDIDNFPQPIEKEASLAMLYNGSPHLFKSIIARLYQKVLRPHHHKPIKKAKEDTLDMSSFGTIVDKMLRHGQGRILPGINEEESVNYLRKYLWLRSHAL